MGETGSQSPHEPEPDLEKVAVSVIAAAEAARAAELAARQDSSVSRVVGKPVEVEIDPIPDTRLYVPDHDDWEVHIKRDSARFYCYSKHPGEDWFHLLLNGEIFVSRQHEKYCLRCALRMGFLTEDRLFWQHRVPRKRPRVV